MRKSTLALFCCLPLFFAACAREEAATQEEQWIIRKIGISAGTMLQPQDRLLLRDRFEVGERELVAVVEVQAGGEPRTVHAQWYMPDASAPMLGETSVELPAGGSQTRLSFANPQDWEASPYLLTVQVTEGNSLHPLSSASFPFFIGMSDAEIRAYWDAQNDAQWRALERTEQLAPEGEEEGRLRDAAARELSTEAPLLAFRGDLTGDGDGEYLFLDTRGQPPFAQPRSPNVLVHATVRRFVVLDGEGSALLRCTEEEGKRILRNAQGPIGRALPAEGGVRLSLSPSLRLTVSWEEEGKSCSTTLLGKEDGFGEEAGVQCSALSGESSAASE
ncbi:MAG: hypothetical protein WCV62_02195 [Candidatus Peribacteraceae bacterium]|jgi:hypothetical protein